MSLIKNGKIDQAALAAFLMKAREKTQAIQASHPTYSNEIEKSVEKSGELFLAQPEINPNAYYTDQYGNQITFNQKQLEAVELGSSLKSCVILGAAGTGKTTIQKQIIANLCLSPHLGLHMEEHKHIPTGVPGLVVMSFTRRSVMNDQKNMPANLKRNGITIHKFLEYEPVINEVQDAEGNYKKIRTFEPKRNNVYPISPNIQVIFITEASMVGTDLFKKIVAACPHDPIFIFTGDIQQLPPVFGDAILGYKMLELPVVELTEVYRQALESPILRLAHRILSGKTLAKDEILNSWQLPELNFYFWESKTSEPVATKRAATILTLSQDQLDRFEGEKKVNLTKLASYNPETDIILTPFNKAFGTLEINAHIAGILAQRNKRIVFEILAGREKRYLAIGDKVLCDKEDAIVTNIYKNKAYLGKEPQPESEFLNYFGNRTDSLESQYKLNLCPDTGKILDWDNIDDFMPTEIDVDKVNQASHVIEVTLQNENRDKVLLNTAGELNSLLLGYALTVHKAQGCEWENVFFLLHHSNAVALCREMLYTAVTRAKKTLNIICEPSSFVEGIRKQKIKGQTLAEKAEFFKGKKLTKGGNYL